MALLAISNVSSTITFSCIVPFLPTEATKRKGLSTTQVGFVIGYYQLIQFFASPIIGKYVCVFRYYLKARNMLIKLNILFMFFGKCFALKRVFRNIFFYQ
uniref:Major facilitator superfamily (MFS) profile domain-containing protein n=1 Tax=Meloidogyne incognita TaxID=6306 RepID=A0A914KHW5_MELIC